MAAACPGSSFGIMFIDRHRDKLINAILYFVENTRHCHTLKLFKLLNFLDFEHFRQTGHGVTGLHYKAWPNGPAPAELWRELTTKPRHDLVAALAVFTVKDETDKTLLRDLKPRRKFDRSKFTKREMEIMEQLAFIFQDASAADMSGVSHARDLPWGKIYRNGAGRSNEIPYELALTSQPVLPDMPSLDDDEYRYRREAFKEIDSRS
jgi:uncharacterized phage-associated protein